MSGSRRLAALARLSSATNAADLRSSSEPSPVSSEPSPVSEPSSSSSSFTPGILKVAIGSMAVGSPASSFVWLASASFVWLSSASSASSSASFLRPSSRNTIDAASCRIRCGSAYCAHPARSRPGRNNALSVTGIHHSRHLLSATPPPSRMQTSSRPRPRPLSVSPFFPLPLPMTHRSDGGVWLGVPGSIPMCADSRSSLSISQRSAALSSLISVPAAQHTLSSRMASRDSSRRFGRISRSLRAPIFGTSAARGTYRPLLCAPRSMS